MVASNIFVNYDLFVTEIFITVFLIGIIGIGHLQS